MLLGLTRVLRHEILMLREITGDATAKLCKELITRLFSRQRTRVSEKKSADTFSSGNPRLFSKDPTSCDLSASCCPRASDAITVCISRELGNIVQKFDRIIRYSMRCY
jgi:hypothetical protein